MTVMGETKILNPIFDGALETLREQCGLKATPGVPTPGQVKPGHDTDIVVVAGVAAEGVRANVALCLPRALYLQAMSRMLGEACPELTEELQDGAADLMKNILKNAARSLKAQGVDLVTTAPTVVVGSLMSVRHLASNRGMIQPFTSPDGGFSVAVGLA